MNMSQSKQLPKSVTDQAIQAAISTPSSTNDPLFSMPISNLKNKAQLLQRFSALTDDFDDIDDNLQDPLASCSNTKKLCIGNKENESLSTKSSIPATNVELLHLLEATSDCDYRKKVSCQSALVDPNTLVNNELTFRKSALPSHIQDMSVQSSNHQETGSALSSMADMCNPQKLHSQNEMFSNPMSNTNQNMLSNYMRNNQRARNTSTNSSKNRKLLESNSVPTNSFHQNNLSSSVVRTVDGEPSLQTDKQYLLNNRSVQSHESVCKDQVQGCHSDQLDNLPSQSGIVPTSHLLWNSQPSQITNVRPSFPGPAGLLPSLDEAEKDCSLDYMSAALFSYQEQTLKAPMPPSAPSVSLGLLWRYMLRDLDIRTADPASPINRHNLERSVVQQQSCGGAGGAGALRRVPLLLVQVSGITPAPGQATLLLHDHTGEVTALLASSAVERWLPLLCCGCALVLTGATVWRRGSGRPAVLTVTADNVAALYAPANKEDGAGADPLGGSSSRRTATTGLDVTVTSGLSLEERRQLKCSIGIDTILERSLVEENHDQQAVDLRNRDGGTNLCGGVENMNNTASNFASNRNLSGNLNVPRHNLLSGIKPDFQPSEATPNFINRMHFNPYRPPINNARNDVAPNLPSHRNIPKNSPSALNSSFKSPSVANIAPPSRFRFSPIIPSPAADSERGRPNTVTNLPVEVSTNINRSVASASNSRGGIWSTPTSRPFGGGGGPSTNVHSTHLRPSDVVNQPATSAGRFHFKANIGSNAVSMATGPSSVAERVVSNPPMIQLVPLNQREITSPVCNQDQNRLSDRGMGWKLSKGPEHSRVGTVSGNLGCHSLTSVSSRKTVISSTKAAVKASVVPSESELKEIRDLITTFADGDFDDF